MSCSFTSTCPVMIHGRASSALSKMPRSASKASSWHLRVLAGFDICHHPLHKADFIAVDGMAQTRVKPRCDIAIQALEYLGGLHHPLPWNMEIVVAAAKKDGRRSEERRVGKECRYRWLPDT